MKPATYILGIDIAKLKFDVHLRRADGTDFRLTASFSNDRKGFQALVRWLKQHAPGAAELLHACLESTSRYGDALAEFLHGLGYQVSLVNPRRTRNYANSLLTRTVNDAIDAQIIADFCVAERHKLRLWEPLSADHRQLQDLTRAREALVEDHDRFGNMLETATGLARKAFQKQIKALERQIQALDKAIQQFVRQSAYWKDQVALADSVTAVGLVTAAAVLAELPPISQMRQAGQAVALFGLDPMSKTSGTSVKTPARISRMGSRRGRRALYMPAVVALRYNPIIRQLGERLKQNGHSGKYIVVAAMRKLLRLIYGVVKQGKPFDPQWQFQSKAVQPETPACASV